LDGCDAWKCAPRGVFEMVDLEHMRAVLREELDARARIDADSHADHHRFISELIERSQRRREFLDKVKSQVVGWAVIAALGSFAAWIARQVGQNFRS
jgi:hypothetical protein